MRECPENREALLREIERCAKIGGAIILGAHASREDIHAKEGHANFVTVYDELVQKEVCAALREVLPEAHFVGEEDGQEVFTPEDAAGYTFVIDPIDGTSNFMKGLGMSVISIGLLKDGAPFMGVIYNPYQDACFSAVAGAGAWKNGERIHAGTLPLSESLVMFGTAPYYDGLKRQSFDLACRYLDRCIDVRRFGAAAWDLCLVAEGKIGLFFELRLSLWDYCAGALIAKEAGCTVCTLLGEPLSFDGKSSVIAVSPGASKDPFLPKDLFGLELSL